MSHKILRKSVSTWYQDDSRYVKICQDVPMQVKPAAGRAARKDKTAPETFHLKKLSRKIKIYDIYAKPVPATSPKSKAQP